MLAGSEDPTTAWTKSKRKSTAGSCYPWLQSLHLLQSQQKEKMCTKPEPWLASLVLPATSAGETCGPCNSGGLFLQLGSRVPLVPALVAPFSMRATAFANWKATSLSDLQISVYLLATAQRSLSERFPNISQYQGPFLCFFLFYFSFLKKIGTVKSFIWAQNELETEETTKQSSSCVLFCI